MKILSFFLFLSFLTASTFAQSLIFVNPTNGQTGKTIKVKITGENVNFQKLKTGQTMPFKNCIQSVLFRRGSEVIGNTGNINITSKTELEANFLLPFISPSGLYDAVVVQQCDPNIQPEYFVGSNLFQIARTNSGTIKAVSPNSGKAGNVLRVKITGENTSFSQYSQGNTPVTYIEGIYLKKGNSVYTVDPYNKTVKINSGTEIEADINIPAGAPEGLYNIAVVQVVQYGSDRYSWVGEELFTMEPDSQIVKPIDSAKQGENTTIVMNDVKRNLNGQYLTDCFLRLRQSTITKRDGLDNKITGLTKTIQDNIDLLTSVIKVIKAETVNAFGPSSVRAVFRIPDDAPVGMYDFVLELNKSELVELLSTIEVQAESKGVEEFAPGDEFVRFIPNPVKDNTKLIFYENNNNDFEITFYNPLGIKTGDFVFLSSRGGYKSHELDLSYLASGIYYYTITCGKRRLSGILSKVK